MPTNYQKNSFIFEVRGADIPHAEPMRSAYLTLVLETPEEAEHIYSLLSNEGEVFIKIEKTPFANRFAMLRDKFGTSWMLLNDELPYFSSTKGVFRKDNWGHNSI